MAETQARIGIMGGTFDPIHYGHLVAAEGVCQHFRLDRVYFVPAGVPPHKPGRGVSAPRHRYMMTVLATVSNPRFAVSAVEIEGLLPSHTVDTLKAFRSLYPPAELHFITGADAILEIMTWKDPKEMLTLAHFVAAARPGYPIGALDSLRGGLPPDLRDRISYIEVPALAISSTDVRSRVAAGRSIKYLVPESVESYIFKEGLYAKLEIY